MKYLITTFGLVAFSWGMTGCDEDSKTQSQDTSYEFLNEVRNTVALNEYQRAIKLRLGPTVRLEDGGALSVQTAAQVEVMTPKMVRFKLSENAPGWIIAQWDSETSLETLRGSSEYGIQMFQSEPDSNPGVLHLTYTFDAPVPPNTSYALDTVGAAAWTFGDGGPWGMLALHSAVATEPRISFQPGTQTFCGNESCWMGSHSCGSEAFETTIQLQELRETFYQTGQLSKARLLAQFSDVMVKQVSNQVCGVRFRYPSVLRDLTFPTLTGPITVNNCGRVIASNSVDQEALNAWVEKLQVTANGLGPVRAFVDQGYLGLTERNLVDDLWVRTGAQAVAQLESWRKFQSQLDQLTTSNSAEFLYLSQDLKNNFRALKGALWSIMTEANVSSSTLTSAILFSDLALERLGNHATFGLHVGLEELFTDSMEHLSSVASALSETEEANGVAPWVTLPAFAASNPQLWTLFKDYFYNLKPEQTERLARIHDDFVYESSVHLNEICRTKDIAEQLVEGVTAALNSANEALNAQISQ